MARSILDVCGNHAGVMLAAIYGITMILNGFMNNNAAAALLFPVAVEASRHLEVSMMPFAIGIMMAGEQRLRHADRLPDQPHGLRSGRLSIQRLFAARRTAQPAPLGSHGRPHSRLLAVLSGFGAVQRSFT
jgi:hypothetical protein